MSWFCPRAVATMKFQIFLLLGNLSPKAVFNWSDFDQNTFFNESACGVVLTVFAQCPKCTNLPDHVCGTDDTGSSFKWFVNNCHLTGWNCYNDNSESLRDCWSQPIIMDFTIQQSSRPLRSQIAPKVSASRTTATLFERSLRQSADILCSKIKWKHLNK